MTVTVEFVDPKSAANIEITMHSGFTNMKGQQNVIPRLNEILEWFKVNTYVCTETHTNEN